MLFQARPLVAATRPHPRTAACAVFALRQDAVCAACRYRGQGEIGVAERPVASLEKGRIAAMRVIDDLVRHDDHAG